MDPQEDFERFLEKYADLEVHESARWPALVASLLARLKRPNLAIVALVAVAYKGLPAPIMLAFLGAITLLGVVGGFRDG
ncbi:hypothetical protein WK39_22530 [Burkholderia cepacia]|uniref:hypothetical protein n=1 Tax=Burkholderia cepacia complex TaxID=87882 RepID=UPI00075B81F2|nr:MULTISPECIES: hypothetical protein [Burkholderia cepacia complex]KVL51887.1 hypothetical protein WS99_15490 [Burkholderia territorii]KVS54815.1 hypothetical protein WK39_22530 [Burkholderia cepacia]KVS58238.1 hypothetical protein WK40_25295 [Burkholderia cepacia]